MRAGVALFVVLASAGAAAAQSADVGRRHARRANELASVGRCAPAIPEFTAAYEILKDPVILFNRAECHRKVGDGEKALADYKEFLQQLPTAPNRAAVEERIAALEKALNPQPEPAPPVPEIAAPEPQKPMPAFLDPHARGDLAVSVPAPAPAVERRGLPSWVWGVAAGVALAGAATAGYLYFGRPRTEIPQSSLGNYRF